MLPSNAAFRKRTANVFTGHNAIAVAFRGQKRGVVTGGDQVDEIHKIREEWNGAGTFGSLVTLKKNEREKWRTKD